MNVVVRTQDGPVSLLVDEIGDVVEPSEDAFEPPAATLQGEARELIRGVYKLKGRLLHVFNLDRAMRVLDGSAARNGGKWSEGAPCVA